MRIANLDTTTNGATDGYQDYSCKRRIQLVQNTTYTLRVQTGNQVTENVAAWIDYNNDGNFTASERVLYSTNATAHAATFTVPVSAILQQPLRLRIAADYVDSPIPTACSTPQYSQTEDYAVRIAPGNPVPVAAFSTPDSLTCTGVVAFQDESRNAPTNWRWTFGDGTTSTQRHPVHTYAAPGTYSVQLRVCNAGGCDSLARPAYVVVRGDGPRPAACAAPTTAYCCQFGITRVQLAGLDHASADGRAGYEDFSCAYRAALTTDQPYILQLTTGPSAHDVRVYLDLNDDGSFGTGELLYQGLGVQSPTVLLVVSSATTPMLGRALRLRIVADYAGSPATDPCGPVAWGQAEDYAVTLTLPTTLPTAGATLRYAQLCGPTRIAFTNTSVRASTYTWDFGDGTTSSVASPQHTYATPGVFAVRLVAQNALGRDTVRLRVAVAASCPSYCPADPANGNSSQPLYFTRVQVADLDNAAPRNPSRAYHDFTDQVATVVAGQSYPLRAESLPWDFAGSGPWDTVEFFLDANQDGQFGPSERIALTSFSPHLLTLRVPADARLGATRLRAIIHFQAQYPYPNGCVGRSTLGGVEDYTVVVLPAALPPMAGFLADLPVSCNPLVQFRDTSRYTPTAWQWSFGDGGTSTAQHPQHSYAAAGTYTVTLQVRNANGTHSLTRTNYVTVGPSAQGPRPAACLPSPLLGTPGGQHGIDTLLIGSAFAYHQPINSPGYRDETCSHTSITLQQGMTYPLRFRDTNPANAYCFVWLDANDNGVLEAPQELLFNSLPSLARATDYLAGPLTLPLNTVLNRPLRLRVISGAYPDYTYPTSIPSPCTRDEAGGQVRDFSVVVTARPLATTGPTVAGASWQAVPNPSTGSFTILGNFATAATVQVLDLTGRSVFKQVIEPNTQHWLTLDLPDLPKGVYLLRVNDALRAQRIQLE